jgi:hypothetical protein
MRSVQSRESDWGRSMRIEGAVGFVTGANRGLGKAFGASAAGTGCGEGVRRIEARGCSE